MSDNSLSNPHVPDTPQTALSPRMHHFGSRRGPMTGRLETGNTRRSLPQISHQNDKKSSLSPDAHSQSAANNAIKTENSMDDPNHKLTTDTINIAVSQDLTQNLSFQRPVLKQQNLMIQIQNKTRPSLDNYINKMMKTVHENPHEGKKMSPAEMHPIKMNNYEISFGK